MLYAPKWTQQEREREREVNWLQENVFSVNVLISYKIFKYTTKILTRLLQCEYKETEFAESSRSTFDTHVFRCPASTLTVTLTILVVTDVPRGILQFLQENVRI
jgi:hypothetical protein